jgi:hypothetical protein
MAIKKLPLSSFKFINFFISRFSPIFLLISFQTNFMIDLLNTK